GAEVALLEGAEVGRDGLLVGGGGVQQYLGLEIAEVEDVAVLLEAAAAPAGDADGTRRGNLAVGFRVQLQGQAARLFGHRQSSALGKPASMRSLKPCLSGRVS